MDNIKYFEWDQDKNKKLIVERGMGFEEIIVAIQHGHLLGVTKGKNLKYAQQHIFIVFVEQEDKIFFKTIYPSRLLHKNSIRVM